MLRPEDSGQRKRPFGSFWSLWEMFFGDGFLGSSRTRRKKTGGQVEQAQRWTLLGRGKIAIRKKMIDTMINWLIERQRLTLPRIIMEVDGMASKGQDSPSGPIHLNLSRSRCHSSSFFQFAAPFFGSQTFGSGPEGDCSFTLGILGWPSLHPESKQTDT